MLSTGAAKLQSTTLDLFDRNQDADSIYNMRQTLIVGGQFSRKEVAHVYNGVRYK